MKPKLLDLYCCEGGASEGYRRAGFDVYGVDIQRRRRYPFPFHQGDAIEVMRALLAGEAIDFLRPDGHVERLVLADFAAIHASPPCQAYSVTRHSHDVEYPDLLEPTRDVLVLAQMPFVIENVPGAPLREPMLLCGSMFGLVAVDDSGEQLALRRHRLFESNVWLMGAGGCVHGTTQVGGVYGGGPMQRDRSDKRGGYTPTSRVQRDLMGIDWMTRDGLHEAIPPAYTEFIGHQLIREAAIV